MSNVIIGEAEDRCILCMMSVILDGRGGPHINKMYSWHCCTILLASNIKKNRFRVPHTWCMCIQLKVFLVHPCMRLLYEDRDNFKGE